MSNNQEGLSEDREFKHNVVIGRNWDEFDRDMTFYIPDSSERTLTYLSLLRSIIDRGLADGLPVTVFSDVDVNQSNVTRFRKGEK